MSKSVEHHNPALYRKLSEPYASPEEADRALSAFWDEVYALREKYKIPDLYMILMFSVKQIDNRIPGDLGLVNETDEAEGTMMARLSAGNPMNTEAMTGWAFGQEQAGRQERISGVVNQALKQAVVKKTSRS